MSKNQNQEKKEYGGMDARTPTTPATQHQALIKEIERILGFRKDLIATFGGSLDSMENGYRLMKEHAALIIKDEPVSVQPHEAQIIGRLFDILVDFVLYRELPLVFRDFAHALCTLGRNWNTNTINDKNLHNNITIIAKVVRDLKTVDDTMDLLRKLIEKGNQIYLYEPPAFKLSEHYFKTLTQAPIEEEQPEQEQSVEEPPAPVEEESET